MVNKKIIIYIIIILFIYSYYTINIKETFDVSSPDTIPKGPNGCSFDANCYKSRYGDLIVLDTNEKLLSHWINYGKNEGRNPCCLPWDPEIALYFIKNSSNYKYPVFDLLFPSSKSIT